MENESSAMSSRVQGLRLDRGELPEKYARSRWKLWTLLLVVLIGGGTWVYRAKINPARPPVEVDFVTVSYEDPVDVVLDATGYVIAHSTIKLSPTIAGRVVKVFVTEGQKVKKGETLAVMDAAQYHADLLQAQAAARHHLLKRDFARAEELMKSRTIPESDYERTHSTHKEASAQLDQLQYALEMLEHGPREETIAAAAAEVAKAKAMEAKAQYFYDATTLKSPIDGTVIELVGQLGEYVIPGGLNAGYCLLADMTNLESEIDIPEQELKAIELGQPCVVTTEAYPGQEYRGRVEWFSPVANRQRGVRRAKIKILDVDQRLMPDLTCRVQVRKTELPSGTEKKLRVPQEAVIDEDGQKFVYVLEDKTSRRRPIEVGEASGAMIEVRTGLKEQEMVLLPGEAPLEDGQIVIPRARTKKAAA